MIKPPLVWYNSYRTVFMQQYMAVAGAEADAEVRDKSGAEDENK